MIAEIIARRKKHKDWPKADLLLIDGGPTQLKAACLNWPNTPIISLAKKQEKIYFDSQKPPLSLGLSSPVLQLLQRIRDEAHRFAINSYHARHQRDYKVSWLDQIKGLGPKTKELLAKNFPSLKQIESTDVKQLEKIIGKQKARILLKSRLKQ